MSSADDHSSRGHSARPEKIRRKEHDHHGHDHHGHNHHGHDHHGHDHHGNGEASAKAQDSHDSHEHGLHGHHHPPPTQFSSSFALAAGLNLAFVGVEAGFGFVTHSMALLADAGHNLGDVLGLLLAWGAAVLAARRPSGRHTYGYRRLTVLATLSNAMVLLLTTGAIAWEALERLLAPTQVQGGVVMVVAAAGVLVNGFSAFLLSRQSQNDLNARAAFLHLVADALVSVAVIVSGGLILATGLNILDPLLALGVSGFIVWSTWSVLKASLNMVLDAAPERISVEGVRHFLSSLPEVEEVHDLHIWSISTSEVALTAHLVLRPEVLDSMLLPGRFAQQLEHEFGIQHATLQLERPIGEVGCGLSGPDGCVMGSA